MPFASQGFKNQAMGGTMLSKFGNTTSFSSLGRGNAGDETKNLQ